MTEGGKRGSAILQSSLCWYRGLLASFFNGSDFFLMIDISLYVLQVMMVEISGGAPVRKVTGCIVLQPLLFLK
jgi:hypothetical protein